MKNNLLILISSVFLIFVACSENERMEFSDENASIYFQLSEAAYQEYTDSLYFSFVSLTKDTATAFMRAKIIGNTVPYNRYFNAKVIDSLTTAETDVNYKLLDEQGQFLVPADSICGYIPIEIYNTDILRDTVLKVTFQLQSSGDFQLGIETRLQAKLLITDRLFEPLTWSFLRYFFGPYNRKKHEMFIQLYERDFPSKLEEIYPEYGMWTLYGSMLNEYFEDNYPVYDDEGFVVEPWR